MRRLRALVSWIAWPGLLAVCVLATAAGFAWKHPQIGFYLTYAGLTAALVLLEHWMPHEVAWSPPDGQLAHDLGHTLLSTSAVQGALMFSSMVGVSLGVTALAGPQYGPWPRTWPIWLQVSLALALLEFALYWAHRLAHEWQKLWYFHAIHHSVPKLWAVNNGRFHFVDALKSVLPGIALMMVLGAPMNVLTWLSALGAYIGMLTHCNVQMQFGPLSLIFNTPELHRWHHSRDLREGNKNYGESLMLWDWVFGTWFNAGHRPPADIGIAEAMPSRFRDQVMWPFQRLLCGRVRHGRTSFLKKSSKRLSFLRRPHLSGQVPDQSAATRRKSRLVLFLGKEQLSSNPIPAEPSSVLPDILKT